ncbi:hypothetical protein SKAU_G00191930 [Synaphobranchus kaupii]|uniref:SCAN box domain-containing protein n=1 Tax=Synaphobranchus kaupii TaxID=118154 RepID=A0A9Q1FDT8_SYNKA|nr:hypothetical protein SKAU_G00191930 [Synaphobranchus kaupii]
MEFDLERFVDDPTLEQLDSCRKADLVLIAEYFKIDVSRSEMKCQIKTKVTEGLLKRQILFEGADPGESTLIKTESPDTTAQTRQFELEMRRLELREKELEAKVRLRELEVEAMQASTRVQSPIFYVSRYTKMGPPFREADVDKYFSMLERVAITLKWPRDACPLLLQCMLVGKATIEQSLDYDVVKAAVLRAYELVPEAYRQKFRRYQKADSQTFVEFAREKETLFDCWCAAQGVEQFEQHRDLIIMEEFKNCVLERVATHLNEHKTAQVAQAAVLADEFSLTHRGLFAEGLPSRPNEVTPRREFPIGFAGPSKTGAPASGRRQDDLGAKGKKVQSSL